MLPNVERSGEQDQDGSEELLVNTDPDKGRYSERIGMKQMLGYAPCSKLNTTFKSTMKIKSTLIQTLSLERKKNLSDSVHVRSDSTFCAV